MTLYPYSIVNMFSCSLPTGFRASNTRRRGGNNISIPVGGWSPAEESSFLASPVEVLCVNVPLDHDAVSLSQSTKPGDAAFTLAYMLGHDEGDLSRIVLSLPAQMRKQFCGRQRGGGADKILSSTVVEYIYSKEGSVVALRVWRLAIDRIFSFSRLFGKFMQANRLLLQHQGGKKHLVIDPLGIAANEATVGQKRRRVTLHCATADEIKCAADLLQLYEIYQNSGHHRARLASGPVKEVINRKFEKSSPLVADPLAAATSTLNAGMSADKRFLAASSPEVHLSFCTTSLCAGLPPNVCAEQCSSKRYKSSDGGLSFPKGAFLWCGGGSFWESPLPTPRLTHSIVQNHSSKQDLILDQAVGEEIEDATEVFEYSS